MSRHSLLVRSHHEAISRFGSLRPAVAPLWAVLQSLLGSSPSDSSMYRFCLQRSAHASRVPRSVQLYFTRCVSSSAHSVISEEKGQCYRVLGSGQGPSSCSLPILRNITKQICCCSRVGKAWGPDCHRCPYFGSGGRVSGKSPGSDPVRTLTLSLSTLSGI